MADRDRVSADDVAGVESEVGEVYDEAERALLGIVASSVMSDLKSGVTDGAGVVRGKLRKYVAGLTRRSRAAADRAIAAAQKVGRATADRSVRNGPDPVPAPPAGRPEPVPVGNYPAEPAAPARDAVSRWDRDALDLRATAPRGPRTAAGVTVRTPDPLKPQLALMAPQMIASAEGIYTDVMAQVLANPIDSEAQRLRLAQRLLDRAAAKGITGYVDKGGRRWSMTSYVEMATRTAAAQSAINAHTQLLADNGYDLVRVSVHENCSPWCQPFQGHLLSITGATVNDGRAGYHQRIVDTLAGARARGFNHPNCKHFVTLWVPGDSLPSAPEVDPENYQATQRLRYLERQVRGSKRRAAVALDEAATRKANARTRALQQQIREHVAANPTVPRMRRREQIDVAR